MPKYAERTNVSIETSRAELERILQRYGAKDFLSGWSHDPPVAVIGFTIQGRTIRVRLEMPHQDDDEFQITEQGRTRKESVAWKAWEQACRQRWRSLCLVVKAKLEAVTSGISTIEREFLADVVMPNGATFGEWIEPQFDAIYAKNKMHPLLPGA